MVEQNYDKTMMGALEEALVYFYLSWDCDVKWLEIEGMGNL